MAEAWQIKYGDSIVGFESLVELPRSGEAYRLAGWTEVGQTHGFTCKRVAGKGSDGWGGNVFGTQRILRPKRVFCKHHSTAPQPIMETTIVTEASYALAV